MDEVVHKPQYDDDVSERERVLVLEDVVEDDPDDAEDGDEEVGAVPLRLQVPVRRERDHLHYHLKIERNVEITHYKTLHSVYVIRDTSIRDKLGD